MDYRREIDGLRALAVVPVILFHAGFQTFSGGFVGVDVFFVISGYLITTIILSELEQGNFSLVNFYERRARRILPALSLVMFACLPFAWVWLLPSDMKEFSESLVAVSIFASNIFFQGQSGYFDTSVELKPLLHTWSLAVEEQFYLLFPLFVMLLWRLGRRRLLAIIGLTLIFSLAYAQHKVYANPASAFYLLPSRAWELLIGVLAAFYLSKSNRVKFSKGISEVCGLLGVILVLYSIFAYTKEIPFPSLYALVPTVGAVFIILFATQETSVGKFVGNKIFVGVGLISYSAYLWHQPLFAFARHISLTEPSNLLFILLSVSTLLLAYLSWKFVELPFRNKDKFDRSFIFLILFIFYSLFIGLGLAGYVKSSTFENYWISRFPESKREFYSNLISGIALEADGKNQNQAECRFNVSKIDLAIESRIKHCVKLYGSGVLILGDSHGTDLYRTVISRFNDDFLIGVTKAGCRPHTPMPNCHYDEVMNFIKNNPMSFRHIIYEQAGFYLLLDKDGSKGKRAMFSSLKYSEKVNGIKIDYEHINKTLDYLNQLAAFVPVTWFLPRVEHHISTKIILKNGCDFSYSLRPGLFDIFLTLESEISDLIKTSGATNLKSISQNDIYGFDFGVDLLNCKDTFWSDGDHFSDNGEARFGMRLPDNFLEQ